MKGKIGLVVGLGVGYVLGTRAGRERYEQIKKQWLKVWHLDPVQDQVTKAKEFVGAKAAAVPGALWTGAVKVVKAVSGAVPEAPVVKAPDTKASAPKEATPKEATPKEAAPKKPAVKTASPKKSGA